MKDENISKDQSSNWQRIADIPEERFEDYVQSNKEITLTQSSEKGGCK